MNSFLRLFYSSCCLAGIFIIASGCTGLNSKQLANDPVIEHSQQIYKAATEKRADFQGVLAEYEHSHDPVYLQRMENIIERLRYDEEQIRYFHSHQRNYRKGLTHERWRHVHLAHDLVRASICETTLATAQMHFLYGDKDESARLFTSLIEECQEPRFKGVVALARTWQNEIQGQPKSNFATGHLASSTVQ